MEQIILVDEKDHEIGQEEKLETHKKGLLHRCFSIFVTNSKGELLLQKRNENKYHSGGLWTNTCCSHPRVGEDTLAAAHRRLVEEMGFDCELKEIYQFIYKAKLDHELTEYEYDHVFYGKYDQNPVPDPEEASDWKWANVDWLKKDVKKNPDAYTYWFKDCCLKVLEIVKGL